MSFFLTNPLYLISLISVIALLVIYFLHRRTQKRKVSALFLWPAQDTTQNNGFHLKIKRLPLSFFRETAALACLAIAATMPFWLGKD
ncbi:MAG: BatA domain-containing protein, partial [Victivallales bacterium]|nr:BatA domain-containing protein [Victivallales bacterium]